MTQLRKQVNVLNFKDGGMAHISLSIKQMMVCLINCDIVRLVKKRDRSYITID